MIQATILVTRQINDWGWLVLMIMMMNVILMMMVVSYA